MTTTEGLLPPLLPQPTIAVSRDDRRSLLSLSPTQELMNFLRCNRASRRAS
ncbi:hypothetical protein [Teichococcus deserti]|uniref:hypothetical protein n=1 Tax=Teichococcus deserti TaxID=1817963 RepID=UPI0013F63B5E|nr:hypothetical protein [Pseudoroseomonas deserti]